MLPTIEPLLLIVTANAVPSGYVPLLIAEPWPPPAPEPIPATPPSVSSATTKQVAPTSADAEGRDTTVASRVARRRVGRGTLRIPLATSGLTKSGLNIPSA